MAINPADLDILRAEVTRTRERLDMVYQPYIEDTHLGGPAKRYRFEGTSYGASVVQHHGSYGGDEGFWELAVIHFQANSEKWSICYCTPVTNDVMGWLRDDEVQDTLAQIDALGDHECTCPTREERRADLKRLIAEMETDQ